MDFLELAKSRYSTRDFSNRQVEDEKLKKILEAGRIAPTAKNMQPIKILVVKDNTKLNDILFNYNAPVNLIVCCDTNNTSKISIDNNYDCGDMDASIVACHMMLEATDLKVNNIWLRGFDSNKIREVLNQPNNIKPVCVIALGYDNEGYTPNERHYIRKEIDEIVEFI